MWDEAKVDGLVAEQQKAENTAAEMLREVKMVIFTLPRGLKSPKRSFSHFRGV